MVGRIKHTSNGRNWEALSENYRHRLERGGITKRDYERGVSVQAARGHAAGEGKGPLVKKIIQFDKENGYYNKGKNESSLKKASAKTLRNIIAMIDDGIDPYENWNDLDDDIKEALHYH